MNLKHSRNWFRSARLSNLVIAASILLLTACPQTGRGGLSYAPIPFSTGQWVEYVKDSTDYDSFHIRFVILGLNETGMTLETDYFTPSETLKVRSFHSIRQNYSIDTFVVQFNDETPYKFVSPGGNFMFDSPIPNLFVWAQQIDTTNWKTIILNNKQYNIFPIHSDRDSVYYCAEVPVFNIARMKINEEILSIRNYGNKGGESIISREPASIFAGQELPENIAKILNLDKQAK